jgi:hypothetical protein
MDINNTTASELVSADFHVEFDKNVRELLESIRDGLLESTESCRREEIIGQLLMEFIADDGFTGDDPESYFAGKFNLHQKQNFMAIASHMGPDWSQALYHAAVFITKVA